jgi:release factor glutamine methyltransferase
MNEEVRRIKSKLAGSLLAPEEVDATVRLLAMHFLHLNPPLLYLPDSQPPANADWDGLWQAVERLRENCPIQYILGETEFCGLPIHVNPSVLIPRPETEELVRWILDDCQEHPLTGSALLDACTGSGCIAVALAKQLPRVSVWATDISQPALEMAARNARLNGCDVSFAQADMLSDEADTALPARLKFNAIVSNPPYVTQADKAQMADNVLRYEPHEALFPAGDDPLIFYERIGKFARRRLTNDGKLYFEINESLLEETQERLRDVGFTQITPRKDIRGKWRMLRAER